MHKRFFALMGMLAMFVAVLLGGATAQAASGTINAGNDCGSQGSVTFNMRNPATGGTALATVGVCGSIGEMTGVNKEQEPQQYKTAPGWCSQVQYVTGSRADGSNRVTGPWNYMGGGGDGAGIWRSIHPGNGYTGYWHARVRHWNC